jgi:hypothetical protein
MSVCSSHLAAPHSVQTCSANSRQVRSSRPPATNHVLLHVGWTLDDGHQVVMQRLGVGDLVGVNPVVDQQLAEKRGGTTE